MDLTKARKEIDIIDNKLIELINSRMNLTRDIALFKKANNMEIFQGSREQEILDKVALKSTPRLANSSKTLFTSIMDISKCLQTQELASGDSPQEYPEFSPNSDYKIGCQGIMGANSHTAALNLFTSKANIEFYQNFEDVFKAVDCGELSFGVIPMQNSTSGSISLTYELLQKYNLFVSSVLKCEIQHCLAVRKNVKLSQINKVYSHEEALKQCKSFFVSNPKLSPAICENTAVAAKMIATDDNNEFSAAICSPHCAELYGLDIVMTEIADIIPNYTKFICISKERYLSKDADTISVMLKLPNSAGSLYRFLTKFYISGVNLKQIQSRQIKGSFDVIFYLDFEGNIKNKEISALIATLSTELEEFKLLGNYRESTYTYKYKELQNNGNK